MPLTKAPNHREDESVLIVNDLPEQLTLMDSLLRKAGYGVRIAEDGLAALRSAKQYQPNLIISDVCMPKLNGLEFCRRLRADNELRSIPILLVSGMLTDSASFVDGLRAGADDYLSFPFDAPQLIAKVARLLERARLDASYRDIFEQSNDVIFTQDLLGRITSINNAGARFIGAKPQDLTGKLFSSAFGILGLETNGNGFTTYFSEADRGREVKHQFQLKNPAGDDRWLELTLAPLRDRGDQLVGLRGLARDITERKQAELALRDSEERYRLLFESIPQPIWVYDEETLRFLTVNEAATRTYGFSRAEFLSLTVTDMESPVTSQDGSGASRSGSSQHQTKQKQSIHVETTSHPLIFDGRNSRLVIVNDVSERNRLDQEQQRMHASLQQAAMEWRQTFDAIDFPVLIVDLEGRISRANYGAELAAGTPHEDLTGQFIATLGREQPWQKAAELIGVLRQSRSAVSEDITDMRTGKTWSIALFLVSEFESLGDIAILIAQDITKRTELEASLRQSRVMSVLGTVVAGVAHEVRNPLFALSSILDAFEKRFPDRPEYQRYTNVLRSEIERLTVLMEDLLEYGKPFLGDLYPVPLVEIISKAINACLLTANAGQVKVVSYVGDGLPPIMVDRRRISTVFINVIENAIQHSPASGIVTLTARKVHDNGQTWIECITSDPGCGIPDADLSNIFEPFFSKRRGGTGLGLAIAQKTMEEHGGQLLAHNNAEGGASLIARFPITPQEKTDG